MDREQSSEGQGRGAVSDYDNPYDALHFAGIRLIDAIARLLRAGRSSKR